jgi:hypothetical protein
VIPGRIDFWTDHPFGVLQVRKRSIQPGHLTTKHRFLFHQINLKSRCGDIEGRLESGNAPPDDERGWDDSLLLGFEGVVKEHFGDGSCDQSFCLFGASVSVTVNP